ncbi:MAG TPA: hypothetical protein VK034_31750 [Enhygromyxa sp.]|nr:hypothetical protein [Enhygromyxa sp.]
MTDLRTTRATGVANEESELLERITDDEFSFGPVTFERKPGAEHVLLGRLDRANLKPLVFEYQPSWTRKSRKEAVERLRRAYGRKFIPLLLSPYLSPKSLDELIEERISGIDGCGNGLLVDPPGIFILRTGAKRPKQYRRPSSPVRLSVYESSNVATLVPRVFFSQPTFPTTTATLNACHARMMALGDGPTPLTLPTVSKALRQLDEDLVTDRRGRERYLRDPSRLLQYLERGFQIPSAPPVLLKSKLSPKQIWARLRAQRPKLRFVMTGGGSASCYTGLAGPGRLQLCVSDSSLAQRVLEATPTRAFPNVELIQTSEEAPYFDSREDGGIVWSSPLQCYLELTRVGADPRERDVAEQLRSKILGDARLK